MRCVEAKSYQQISSGRCVCLIVLRIRELTIQWNVVRKRFLREVRGVACHREVSRVSWLGKSVSLCNKAISYILAVMRDKEISLRPLLQSPPSLIPHGITPARWVANLRGFLLRPWRVSWQQSKTTKRTQMNNLIRRHVTLSVWLQCVHRRRWSITQVWQRGLLSLWTGNDCTYRHYWFGELTWSTVMLCGRLWAISTSSTLYGETSRSISYGGTNICDSFRMQSLQHSLVVYNSIVLDKWGRCR